MKTGVRILDETDREIAKLICVGEGIEKIAKEINRDQQFVYSRVKKWKEYYEVNSLTELQIIFYKSGFLEKLSKNKIANV